MPLLEAKKNPHERAFLSVGQTLLDLRFLVDHVLARPGIILPGFHLFRMQSFVLGCRVKVTGSGTGDKSDFLSHLLILSATRCAVPVRGGPKEPSRYRVCR
jgi:hypothetical protein